MIGQYDVFFYRHYKLILQWDLSMEKDFQQKDLPVNLKGNKILAGHMAVVIEQHTVRGYCLETEGYFSAISKKNKVG